MSIENIGTGIFILLGVATWYLVIIESRLRTRIQDNPESSKAIDQVKEELKHQNDMITLMITRHEGVPDLWSISDQLSDIGAELSEQTALLEEHLPALRNDNNL